jgi:hypothetical protein
VNRVVLMTRAFAATLLVVAVAASRVSAQSVVAGPTTSQIATAVGDRITVPVKVDMTAAAGLALGSYQARLQWDPSVFNFVSSSSGSFGPALFNTD